MSYEIIDFHTHPFTDPDSNICNYKENSGMSIDDTKGYLQGLGIHRICGSVICRNRPQETIYETPWDAISESNRRALMLRDTYGDFYIPGIHVHPDYVQQSCEEIQRMSRLGIRLIGELVPYMHDWSNYTCKAFDEILDTASQFHMVINFHPSQDEDAMDTMVKRHPNTVFVAAHPGEHPKYMRHLQRMEFSENYHLDLSGTGLFRHRMLRYGIDRCGAHRFLFGSDYPTCNPAMFIGGVLLDPLITPQEKDLIFSKNAKRLLDVE